MHQRVEFLHVLLAEERLVRRADRILYKSATGPTLTFRAPFLLGYWEVPHAMWDE